MALAGITDALAIQRAQAQELPDQVLLDECVRRGWGVGAPLPMSDEARRAILSSMPNELIVEELERRDTAWVEQMRQDIDRLGLAEWRWRLTGSPVAFYDAQAQQWHETKPTSLLGKRWPPEGGDE